MGAFEYTALDGQGRARRGVLEGDAARQIRQQLREQGLTPLAVEAVVEREARAGRGRWQRGVSATDLALITRQWATLVRSGLPIDEALATLARQTAKARLRSMLTAVRARVMEGHPLATALSDFPQVFSAVYRSTVAAGEQSGHLDVVLERLADFTEARQQLTQKILLALIYPLLLTTVAGAVVLLLLTYVVPQVMQVFEDLDQELPLLTRALIASSDFLQRYGLVLLLLIAALAMLYVYLLRTPAFRVGVHRLWLRLPLAGRLVRGLNTARFTRTFSILVASGVPVLEGMRIAGQVMTNLPMRTALEEAARRVREGSGIYTALAASDLFPPMTVNLIGSGEASGRLEEMLARAASAQERETETLVAGLMGLFEPLLILAMGGLVLMIVLAILLPIFDLNQLVQ